MTPSHEELCKRIDVYFSTGVCIEGTNTLLSDCRNALQESLTRKERQEGEAKPYGWIAKEDAFLFTKNQSLTGISKIKLAETDIPLYLAPPGE